MAFLDAEVPPALRRQHCLIVWMPECGLIASYLPADSVVPLGWWGGHFWGGAAAVMALVEQVFLCLVPFP